MKNYCDTITLSVEDLRAKGVDYIEIRFNKNSVSVNQNTNVSKEYARSDKNQQHNRGHSDKLPMSPKQKEFIQSLADKKGLDLEETAQDIAGKRLSNFTSFDANKMIKHLQNDHPF